MPAGMTDERCRGVLTAEAGIAQGRAVLLFEGLRLHDLEGRTVHESDVHREVLEFGGFGERVALAQRAEPVARERLEGLSARTGVYQGDAVAGAQAQVQSHVGGRNLGEHRVVAAQEVVGVSAGPATSRTEQVRDRRPPVAIGPQAVKKDDRLATAGNAIGDRGRIVALNGSDLGLRPMR